MRRLTLLITAVAFAAISCAGSPSAETLGADLYNVSCARCHGGNLEGGIGPAVDADSNTALALTDEQIANVILVGPGAMPAFGQLSDDQIQSLVDYLRRRHADG